MLHSSTPFRHCLFTWEHAAAPSVAAPSAALGSFKQGSCSQSSHPPWISRQPPVPLLQQGSVPACASQGHYPLSGIATLTALACRTTSNSILHTPRSSVTCQLCWRSSQTCPCMSTCTTCAKPSRPPPPKQRPSAPPSSTQVGCPKRCVAVRHERWSSGGTQLVKEGLSCTHSGCCFSLFWHVQHQQCQQHQQPALLQATVRLGPTPYPFGCQQCQQHQQCALLQATVRRGPTPSRLAARQMPPSTFCGTSCAAGCRTTLSREQTPSRQVWPPDAAGCIVAWLPWTWGLTSGSLSTRP